MAVWAGTRDRHPRGFLCLFPLQSNMLVARLCNSPSPLPGRSPGEGNGYPLQCSGLENSMDHIVHGVAKNRTWLSDFHFHFPLPGPAPQSRKKRRSSEQRKMIGCASPLEGDVGHVPYLQPSRLNLQTAVKWEGSHGRPAQPPSKFPLATEWLSKATMLTIPLPQRDKEVRWKIIRSKGVLWLSWEDSAVKGSMDCGTGDLVGSQTSQRTLVSLEARN